MLRDVRMTAAIMEISRFRGILSDWEKLTAENDERTKFRSAKSPGVELSVSVVTSLLQDTTQNSPLCNSDHVKQRFN